MADSLPAASVAKWTGLYRSVDPMAIAPGALQVADNVVIPGPSLLQPRRGFKAVESFGVDIAVLGQFADYLMVMSAHDTPIGSPDALFHLDPTSGVYSENTRGASTFTLVPALLGAFGSNLAPTQTRTRFVNDNANFYASANFGTARVEDPTGTWVPAGMDTPLLGWIQVGGTLLPALGSTVAGVTYTYGSQVAYRLTYRYEDTNGNVHRSPPSFRFLVVNTSGSANDVGVYAYPTPMVLPGTIVEFWRTFMVPVPPDGTDSAGDEMFKVAEKVITGANIITGSDGYLIPNTTAVLFASIQDATPNVPFLVEPLYTNPTTGNVNGLGIANANTPPPASADTFTFKGRAYYANTEEVQSLTIQIIGTGTGGILTGDTFSIDGHQFKWYDSGAAPGAPFTPIKLYRTGGSFDAGSIVENIRQSAYAASFALNQIFGDGGVYLGTSSPLALDRQLRSPSGSVDGLPGYLTLSRLIPGADAFTVIAGTGAGRGWAGALADSTSDPNRQPANLMQSHPSDSESVPPAFTNVIGRLELPILRGLALRDNAYLFKGGDDGLWKFSDDGSGALTIGPVDQTIKLVAPETAVTLDNSLFCLCDEGVLQISDGGSPVNVSNDKIQSDLADLMRRVGFAALARLAFGVAYESDHTYVLALPESPNAFTCTVQYIYNLQTGAWTRWTLPALSCGIVTTSVDELCFGLRPFGVVPLPGTVWIERKSGAGDVDAQDPGFNSTVPGVGTYTAAALTFTGNVVGGAEGYAPGDFIRYTRAGISTLARITAVTLASGAGSTLVTLDQSVTWGAGDSFSVLKGVQAVVELLPLVADDPLYEKQWQNAYFFFRYSNTDNFNVSYSTEKQAVPVAHTMDGNPEAPFLWSETLGFGLEAWGSRARNVILKLALDQATARGAELTLRLATGDALAIWQLSALRIPYNPATMRVVA